MHFLKRRNLERPVSYNDGYPAGFTVYNVVRKKLCDFHPRLFNARENDAFKPESRGLCKEHPPSNLFDLHWDSPHYRISHMEDFKSFR
jgi:hypothetical protein